jgi:hypothetical protein
MNKKMPTLRGKKMCDKSMNIKAEYTYLYKIESEHMP